MGQLERKAAIITGGASGIGAVTARLFAAEGADVVIADLQDEKGQRLAAALGSRAIYCHTDVSQETEVQAMVGLAVSRYGRLDCLFNNAGFDRFSRGIEDISAEWFDRLIGVLLRGVFLGMKYAAPVMKRQGSGSIVNTGSVAGLQVGYGSHLYSAAKAAVIHLTRSVAMELGESGVRVNCICPGAIATPLVGQALGLSAEEAEGTMETLKAWFGKFQSIPRAGMSEDIARAALWLASEASGFVNGHALVVDGGLTGGRKWSVYQERSLRLHSAMGMPGEPE
ncbi:MAG: glucose 1-dehydrogenase [Armatimonadetes bacterium]|nr:glucose 1-dehydrogenase [Armatimonadota bacterium]